MNKVNRNELLKRVQELHEQYPLPLCDGCHKFNVSLKEIIVKGWFILAHEKEFITMEQYNFLEKFTSKIEIFNILIEIDKETKKHKG